MSTPKFYWSKYLLNGLVLSVSGVLALVNFWEWAMIEVFNQADTYPFGDSLHLPYYYKNAELYATVHLFWATLFSVAFVISLVTVLAKKRMLVLLSFVLSLALFVGMIYHSTIGVQ